MSISGALANALSGLTASSRAAGVVSSNLANVHTDGYGRRDIELSPQRNGTHGGVRVVGITRNVDRGVLGDRRLADSGLAHAQTRSAFFERVQNTVGTPDQPGSISARIAALESSLVSAASRPEAPERLQAAVLRAGELVNSFSETSESIQALRMEAEEEIQFSIRSLNTALEQVQDLNVRIGDAVRRGFDSSSLQDHRQVVVDRIAEIVPVQEVPRKNGMVALMTPNGTMILDDRPVEYGFTRANVIAPHMTLENGQLSGLSINGVAVKVSGKGSPVEGGKLAALFDVRDDLAVDAQTQLDALARDLVERFQQSGLDPTLATGDAGLFTDGGAAFATTSEIGISGRLTVNAAVDPYQGGELWRLRDGLGATTPGPTGDATLLNALTDSLTERRVLSSGDLGTGSGNLAAHASGLVSRLGQATLAEDQATGFAAARQTEFQTMLLRDGVDTDAETQRLLLIEQSFGANARMIQTLDEMMQTLLRI